MTKQSETRGPQRAPAWVYGSLLLESERLNRAKRVGGFRWFFLSLGLALIVSSLLPRC